MPSINRFDHRFNGSGRPSQNSGEAAKTGHWSPPGPAKELDRRGRSGVGKRRHTVVSLGNKCAADGKTACARVAHDPFEGRYRECNFGHLTALPIAPLIPAFLDSITVA
jgi:hypothetical protein